MQLAAATPKVNPYHNMHELFRIMKFGGRRGRGSKLHLKNDCHTIVPFGAIFYACERMQLEITDGHLSNAPPCASVRTDSGVPYHLEGPIERENLGIRVYTTFVQAAGPPSSAEVAQIYHRWGEEDEVL